jgi:hypothetical protein
MRRSLRLALVLAAVVATTTLASTAHADPPTELMGDGGEPIPLKNAAMITKTGVGYRYQAGQQDSHLVVTQVGRRVRFVDTGTAELRRIPGSCRRERVRVGIAASCRVAARFTEADPMFLEIWPRLGNDVIDGSALPASYRLWALVDAGNDTVYGGAGDDFVNGAQNNDKAWGGAGDDWIRTGIGRDRIWGGAGDDKLAGVDGADQVHGGDGDDRVYGGSGNDRLWGDTGDDRVVCAGGTDRAWIDGADRPLACESVELLTAG